MMHFLKHRYLALAALAFLLLITGPKVADALVSYQVLVTCVNHDSPDGEGRQCAACWGDPQVIQGQYLTACKPAATSFCAAHGGIDTSPLMKDEGSYDASYNCNAPVTGICGYANGNTYGSAPHSASALCSSGNPTAVTGTGPWYWNCNGSNGGTTMSCSSALCPAPAQCGTAAVDSSGNVTSGSLCTTGTASAVDTSSGAYQCTSGASTQNCTATVPQNTGCVGETVVANGSPPFQAPYTSGTVYSYSDPTYPYISANGVNAVHWGYSDTATSIAFDSANLGTALGSYCPTYNGNISFGMNLTIGSVTQNFSGSIGRVAGEFYPYPGSYGVDGSHPGYIERYPNAVSGTINGAVCTISAGVTHDCNNNNPNAGYYAGWVWGTLTCTCNGNPMPMGTAPQCGTATVDSSGNVASGTLCIHGTASSVNTSNGAYTCGAGSVTQNCTATVDTQSATCGDPYITMNGGGTSGHSQCSWWYTGGGWGDPPHAISQSPSVAATCNWCTAGTYNDDGFLNPSEGSGPHASWTCNSSGGNPTNCSKLFPFGGGQ